MCVNTLRLSVSSPLGSLGVFSHPVIQGFVKKAPRIRQYSVTQLRTPIGGGGYWKKLLGGVESKVGVLTPLGGLENSLLLGAIDVTVS